MFLFFSLGQSSEMARNLPQHPRSNPGSPERVGEWSPFRRGGAGKWNCCDHGRLCSLWEDLDRFLQNWWQI